MFFLPSLVPPPARSMRIHVRNVVECILQCANVNVRSSMAPSAMDGLSFELALLANFFIFSLWVLSR